MAKGVKRRIALVAVLLTVGSFGVLFSSPARAMIESVMSCASTTPCLEWDNTKSGDGVKGVSTTGSGLEGLTKFKSAGKTAGKAGVLGQDTSTSGSLNSGVSGVSVNGAGVTGTSTNLNGVQGFSASGASGVYGQNSVAGGFGVAGRNTATTHDNGGAGVLADGGTQDDGLHAFGYGSSANAIYAFSQTQSALFANQGPNATAPEVFIQSGSGTTEDMLDAVNSDGVKVLGVSTFAGVHMGQGLYASDSDTTCCNAIGQFSASGPNPAIWMFSGTSRAGNVVEEAFDSGRNALMYLDDSGNLKVFGQIYTQGSCNSGCVVSGKRVASVGEFNAVASEPTIEDNGEGALVNGNAYVPLDPKFANVIAQDSSYLVTVTPEGDCNGLFVTQRTSSGFVVRELHGGRSSVDFAYRIVAHRYGIATTRLPLVPERRIPPPSKHIGGSRFNTLP